MVLLLILVEFSAGVSPTPFTRALFAITDVQGTKRLTFYDFVVCIWNACTMDFDAVREFVFDVLDADSAGTFRDCKRKDLPRLIDCDANVSLCQ